MSYFHRISNLQIRQFAFLKTIVSGDVSPILNSNRFELRMGGTLPETIVFRQANYLSWRLLIL